MSLFEKIKKGLEEAIAFQRGEGEARVTYACSPRDDRFAVIITPPQKGDKYYLVYIPDLDVYTEGKAFDDALFMAKDAIELLGVCRQDHGQEVQKSKNLNPDCKNGEIVAYVDVDYNAYRKKLEEYERRKKRKKRITKEDKADLKAYKAAEAEFKENPKTYTFQEVLDGYDKKKS